MCLWMAFLLNTDFCRFFYVVSDHTHNALSLGNNCYWDSSINKQSRSYLSREVLDNLQFTNSLQPDTREQVVRSRQLPVKSFNIFTITNSFIKQIICDFSDCIPSLISISVEWDLLKINWRDIQRKNVLTM